jgi:dimethylhistidine N-methyltransferase
MSARKTKEIASELYRDAAKGLSKDQKQLPSKYFYDERGSDLFEQICALDEYYPTDCEMEIMSRYIDEIARYTGENVQLIELGSGSSLKTRLLLKHCKNLNMYVPVDISGSFLKEVADKLRKEFPEIGIYPVAADYTLPFEIPGATSADKRVVYYPGSTIGNFTQENAKQFLGTIAGSLHPGDGLLIGVDLKKDTDVLEAAYNDKKGITAEFNKNMLRRLNRELGADFDVNQFRHKALYNREKGRIEMHLESTTNQVVRLNGQQIYFEKGETIHTENSHKYTIEEFIELTGAQFKSVKTWTDRKKYFSVHYFGRV